MVNDVNDDLFDETVERQVNNLRVAESEQRKVVAELNKLQELLITRIAVIDPTGTSEKFAVRRMRRLLEEAQGLIRNSYSNINDGLRQDLTELARIEAGGIGKMLQSTVTDVVLSTTSLPAVRVNSIYRTTLIEGSPAARWWRRQSQELVNKFGDEMRQGLLLGETNQQLTRRVRGTRAFNFTNGIMAVTKRDAEALTRTATMQIANEARFDMFRANSNVISTVRHSSVLDNRTSTICVVRDGKRWKLPDMEPIGHNLPLIVPPVHFNCRSVIVPEVEGATLPDKAQRAALGGPVSAKTTFADFLKGKSKRFQDDLLGEGRAELLRSGDITLRQLLDTRGNPLTLTQLEAKLS